MVSINGKQYTSDYIVRAVAAMEAARIEDTGTDGSEISLVMKTEKGQIYVSFSATEYHAFNVDLLANSAECAALGMDPEEADPDGEWLLIATIEVPDVSTDIEGYREKAGKVPGCPRIFLYDRMGDDCSHILMTDCNGLKIADN